MKKGWRPWRVLCAILLSVCEICTHFASHNVYSKLQLFCSAWTSVGSHSFMSANVLYLQFAVVTVQLNSVECLQIHLVTSNTVWRGRMQLYHAAWHAARNGKNMVFSATNSVCVCFSNLLSCTVLLTFT